MAQFTPGPWRAEGPDEFGDFNILHNGDALAVAAVVSNMRKPGEVKANARMIAAGPALYEALKKADEILASFGVVDAATRAALSQAQAEG